MISHIEKYEKTLYTPVSSMGGSRMFYWEELHIGMMVKMLDYFL